MISLGMFTGAPQQGADPVDRPLLEGAREGPGPENDSESAPSRPAESAPFPAVLLALASLATPVQAVAPNAERQGVVSPLEGEDALPVDVLDETASVHTDEAYDVLFAGADDGDDALVDPAAAYVLSFAEVAPTASAGMPVGIDVGTELTPAVLDDASEGGQVVADTVTLNPSMLRRLSPDFVSRLERVATRMWDEYGVRVDLVEGYRPQARQDTLFAQGRTAEGPVVTWTRQSLHTVGAAADVFVDGAPVNPQQAAILSRIATEEGLRTLYPFDSGHIQLGGEALADGPEGDLGHSLPQTGIGGSGLPPGVARPAPVARPAAVARPARPGGMASAEGVAPPERQPRTAPEAVIEGIRTSLQSEVVREAGRPRPSAGPAPADTEPLTPSVGQAGKEAGSVSTAEAGSPSVPDARAADPRAASLSARAGTVAEANAGEADAAARMGVRAATVAESVEQAQAYQYRRLHLPIEGIGGRASLDVGIRPGGVEAALTVSDPTLADALRGSLHELRQALSDRGIDSRGLSVRLSESPVEALVAQQEATSSRSGDSGAGSTHDGRRSAFDSLEEERERNGRARTEQEQSMEEDDAPRR